MTWKILIILMLLAHNQMMLAQKAHVTKAKTLDDAKKMAELFAKAVS